MVSEDVPRDCPEGRIVEKMAGEDVPKLINAAEDSRAGSEPIVLKLILSDSGMPEVVSLEEAIVAAIVEETTWMVVEPVSSDNGKLGLAVTAADAIDEAEESNGPSPFDKEIGEATVAIIDVAISEVDRGESRAVVAVDRSGPSPFDKEMGEATVATADVAMPGVDKSVDTGARETSEGSMARELDSTLNIGKVPVMVDVPSPSTVRANEELPRTDTIAGLDSDPSFSLDTDRSGFEHQHLDPNQIVTEITDRQPCW